MSTARFVRVLVAVGCSSVVLATFGADVAFAGSCNPGSFNFNFQLGVLNTCDLGPTQLNGTGPNGIFVQLTGGSANTRPVIGYASNAGNVLGALGVWGSTDSTGSYSAGVAGALNSSTPAADGAGVRGVAYTTGANGAGVWGNHQSSSGKAPGVLGDTASRTANAIGVQGVILATIRAWARPPSAESTGAPAPRAWVCGVRTRARAGACTDRRPQATGS